MKLTRKLYAKTIFQKPTVVTGEKHLTLSWAMLFAKPVQEIVHTKYVNTDGLN